MLRVTTLYAATASATALYYTRYLTQADGEEPGVWMGGQAAGLGLSGEVTTEAVARRCSRVVTRSPGPRWGTRCWTGSRRRAGGARGGRVRCDVLGTEVVVGVVGAVRRRRDSAECHDVAVRAVVGCIEKYGSTTRIRSNGHRLHPETQGLTVAVFRQTTSRLDDPQLHSHVVISSKVQTDDGRWLALDARTLKRLPTGLGWDVSVGAACRADRPLRGGVRRDREGSGRDRRSPPGVAGTVLQTHRAGRRRVPDGAGRVLDPRGPGPVPERTRCASAVRPLPTPAATSPATVSATCAPAGSTEAADGRCHARLVASRHRPPRLAGTGDRAVSADQEVMAELTDRRSAWHRLDVLQALCDTTRPQPDVGGAGLGGGAGTRRRRRSSHRVSISIRTSAARDAVPDGRSVWIEPSARHHTSPRFWCRRNGSCRGRSTPNWLRRRSLRCGADGLDAMQREAASVIAGQDRLVLIVGPAGAGKTTMLAAVARHLGVQGRDVFGLAPTAKAARKLETRRDRHGHGRQARVRMDPPRPTPGAPVVSAGRDDGDRRRSRHARHRAPAHPDANWPITATGGSC